MSRLATVIGVFLFLCSNSQAQTSIDVSKISCEQYNLFKVADPEKIAIWLSGYYHGVNKNTVLETQRLEENAKKLREFCYLNRKTQIFEAVEKVLGGKTVNRR
jgi:acid stress chaperone HdeB